MPLLSGGALKLSWTGCCRFDPGNNLYRSRVPLTQECQGEFHFCLKLLPGRLVAWLAAKEKTPLANFQTHTATLKQQLLKKTTNVDLKIGSSMLKKGPKIVAWHDQKWFVLHHCEWNERQNLSLNIGTVPIKRGKIEMLLGQWSKYSIGNVPIKRDKIFTKCPNKKG